MFTAVWSVQTAWMKKKVVLFNLLVRNSDLFYRGITHGRTASKKYCLNKKYMDKWNTFSISRLEALALDQVEDTFQCSPASFLPLFYFSHCSQLPLFVLQSRSARHTDQPSFVGNSWISRSIFIGFVLSGCNRSKRCSTLRWYYRESYWLNTISFYPIKLHFCERIFFFYSRQKISCQFSTTKGN